MATVELKVPDLGEFSDVEIIEVLVKPGDALEADDPVITLETDKAAMDVPATEAGTVSELMVGVGDMVSEGDVVLTFEPADGGEAAAPGADSPEDEHASTVVMDPGDQRKALDTATSGTGCPLLSRTRTCNDSATADCAQTCDRAPATSQAPAVMSARIPMRPSLGRSGSHNRDPPHIPFDRTSIDYPNPMIFRSY